MKFNKIFLSAWVLPILMVISLSGLAQDSVTVRILTIDGQVEIRRRPDELSRVETVALRTTDRLQTGDTIITGRNGRLVIGLSDGSQAVIAPKTTVRIDSLTESPRSLFNLIKGKTRIQIEKLGGRPNPYRINTPTAVIAVRGTVFDLLVDEDETEVYLHEGEVEVTSRRFPDQPLLIFGGQSTRIGMLRVPSLPQVFKEGRNDGVFRTSSRERIPVNDRTAGRGASERGASGSARGPLETGSRSPQQSGRGGPIGERFPSLPGSQAGLPGMGQAGSGAGERRSSGRRP